jgi:hypothetical protein
MVKNNSRKGAKAQSAAAFLKDFFAPWSLAGRRSPPEVWFFKNNSRKGAKAQSAAAFPKNFFAPWRLCGRRFSLQKLLFVQSRIKTEA